MSLHDKALQRTALRLAAANWDVLRRYNGKRGPQAVRIRSAALASLQGIYATSVGLGIGAPARWAAAGVVWPRGDSE